MNNKVPFAILSCFTIAFVLQGILKLCGVFVFEKALNWDIFGIIDSTMWLAIIYYSIFVFITMYCLSFSFRRRAYSNKWYHYVILVVFAFGTTALKFLTNTAFTTTGTTAIDILYDLLLYIAVPLLIYFTSAKEDRLFKDNSLKNVVSIIVLQIFFYFLYLGLNYWSGLLSTIPPVAQNVVYAASALLLQIEVYIGLVALMLSINIFIKTQLKEDNMYKPINIASDAAKIAELKRVEKKKTVKNDK